MTNKIAPAVGTVIETVEDLANVSALWLYEAMYDATTLQNVDASPVCWSDFGDFDHFPWKVNGIPEGFTVAEEPESPWQPIETAPKGECVEGSHAFGEEIDLYADGKRYGNCAWYNDTELWVQKVKYVKNGKTQGAFNTIEDPTHWMPLPSLPSEKGLNDVQNQKKEGE